MHQLVDPWRVGHDPPSTYSSEAPALGLTGSTRIVITPYGIMADVVASGLNLPSDLLWRCAAREADALDVAPSGVAVAGTCSDLFAGSETDR
jgi:hypothetical protein